MKSGKAQKIIYIFDKFLKKRNSDFFKNIQRRGKMLPTLYLIFA